MSNKPIEMYKIRQILRLYGDGRGSRYISKLTGVARNTVKKYLLAFMHSGLTLDEADKLNDSQLAELILTERPVRATNNERSAHLEAMLPALSQKLKKRGVTKGMLYEEYIRNYPDGYKRSRFLELLNRHTGMVKPSVRIPHQAGDKMFIDFTGKKLQIVDKQSGEVKEVEVFVSVLGCSQYTFVTAVASQKKEDFMAACEQALHFYGGVPLAIVPDNLKSAVTKAGRYESELNESFAAFAEHYGTHVFPARVYKPKDKALVEGAVKIIYSTIFTKIDEQVYTDLDSLNKDILLHLEAHNNALLTGCDYSRHSQFETLEKDTLKPLNPYRYDPMAIKMATVGKTGYISIDHRYYSVPYKYIGKRIKLMYNQSKIEAYSGYELIAAHVRHYGKEKYIEDKEHLASWQRYPAEWNPEKFMADAEQISPVVAGYIKNVLARSEYPEKNYRSCQGILNFKKRVGAQRLINACKRANEYHVYNYGMIERILQSRADFIPMEEDTLLAEGAMPEHDNIRGGDYYQ